MALALWCVRLCVEPQPWAPLRRRTHTAVVLPGMWWKTVASPTTSHSNSYKQSHSCFVNNLYFSFFLIDQRQQGVTECRVLDESTSVLFSEGCFLLCLREVWPWRVQGLGYINQQENKVGVEGSFKEALQFQLSVRTSQTGQTHYEKRSSSHKRSIIFYKCFPWWGGPPAGFCGSCFCFQFLLHMWHIFQVFDGF